MTSVHGALDTRIFFKECLSLAQRYRVSLLAPAARRETLYGIHIIPLPRPKSRLYRFFITDISLFWKAWRLRADVYHFHDPELLPIGLLLRRLGKKVIYDVHENVSLDILEKSWLPMKGAFRRLYHYFERQAGKKLGIVLANASSEAYFAPIAKNYVLVQNFVKPELLTPCRRTEKSHSNKLLLVGNLSARRGLDTMIEALYQLRQRGISLELICVGKYDNALKEKLRWLPHYENIKSQLTFRGQKTLSEAYADAPYCLAGIALLEDVANHRICYPTKLFEYMAVGLPVLLSDFPLYKEATAPYHCALTVNPDDTAAIADALERLYTHQQEAWQMGMNGLKAILDGHFNWQTEEARLFHLYENILT